MTRPHILVVDDEALNLEIIREFLEEDDYRLDLVASGEAAWQRLTAEEAAYDLVILDRMMPGMSGIDLLRRMKADERLRAMPVIMQTAASAPQQVREGIEAGAYYYLAKPYEPEVLAAIVRAALADAESRQTAMHQAAAHIKAMALLDRAEFSFRCMGEIGALIEVLASLCPEPARAAHGLTELLVNAVEHGSLGISYADKKRLRLAKAWDAEIARRESLPENRDRRVWVQVERHADRIEFGVRDEGPGFDWQRFLEFDPERAADPNGRGIAMARMMSFDALEFHGRGNVAIATVLTVPRATPPL